MAHYPEVMEERSPRRGQIIVYRDHPSTSSTEDNDTIDDQEHLKHARMHSTSPTRTNPYIDGSMRTKKTSCPEGYLVTRREKSIKSRPRPKSLAFDQEMMESNVENTWLIDQSNAENNESLDTSILEHQDSESYRRIRKYRSVISLTSDNTSSVQTMSPQPRAMSKSAHQSPIKSDRTNPKMIDVSPQYFSSSQSKSKDQQIGASRVKQLLFRRMSRSSDSKNVDVAKQESVSKRSKSSSSPSTTSNLRFLKKKTNENEEDFLLNSPSQEIESDQFDVSHDRSINSDTIPSEPNRPTLYSSAEESD